MANKPTEGSREPPSQNYEVQPHTSVTVSFDLCQSIDGRGFKQPDTKTLRAMQRAFADWLLYETEEHWSDIVEPTGFDFAEVQEGGAS